MVSSADEYLTAREVADILRLTPHGVRAMIRSGRLPAARIGRNRYRIRRGDVDAMLEAGRMAVANGEVPS